MNVVLVTGGAGYIGSNVVKTLVSAGFFPIIIDDFSTGSIVKYGSLVKICISDPKLSYWLNLANPVAVVHLAARAYIQDSFVQEDHYIDNNVNKMAAMLSRLGDLPVVFASSCAVYGASTGIITEDKLLHPINPYGRTKVQGECLLQQRANTTGASFVALRFFNVAGTGRGGEFPENHDPEPHILPNILRLRGTNTPLQINGSDYATPDGTCVRDYVHITDVSVAILNSIQYLLDGGAPTICNIGTGVGTSISELVELVEDITGVSITKKYAPRREGDPDILVADIHKAEKVLSWKPIYNIRQIIQSSVSGTIV